MGKNDLPIKPRIIGTYTPKDRSKENAWLARNQSDYAGQWIALDGNRLISHDFLLKDVMVEVKKAGVADALVVRAEGKNMYPEIGANLEIR